MHKRRERGMTAQDISDMDRALTHGDWDAMDELDARLEQRRVWDEQYPTGEGSTVERYRRAGKWVEQPCTYQWVRVRDGKERVLGTFYIRHHDGEVLELFITPARKGVRPNPYGRSLMSKVSWRKDDAERVREWREEQARRAAMTPAEREQHMEVELEKNREDMERRRQRAEDDPQYAEYLADDLAYLQDEEKRIRSSWNGEVRRETRPLNTNSRAVLGATGLSEAHKVKGQRPTTGVQPTRDLDGDVRFTFRAGNNGFSVRGSKLGPVLLGFRRAGYQQVNLDMVRAAIDRVA